MLEIISFGQPWTGEQTFCENGMYPNLFVALSPDGTFPVTSLIFDLQTSNLLWNFAPTPGLRPCILPAGDFCPSDFLIVAPPKRNFHTPPMHP